MAGDWCIRAWKEVGASCCGLPIHRDVGAGLLRFGTNKKSLDRFDYLEITDILRRRTLADPRDVVDRGGLSACTSSTWPSMVGGIQLGEDARPTAHVMPAPLRLPGVGDLAFRAHEDIQRLPWTQLLWQDARVGDVPRSDRGASAGGRHDGIQLGDSATQSLLSAIHDARTEVRSGIRVGAVLTADLMLTRAAFGDAGALSNHLVVVTEDLGERVRVHPCSSQQRDGSATLYWEGLSRPPAGALAGGVRWTSKQGPTFLRLLCGVDLSREDLILHSLDVRDYVIAEDLVRVLRTRLKYPRVETVQPW